MRKVKIKLRCEYSESELNEKRDEISNVIIGAHEVETRKAETNKIFKEQLEALYSRRDVLAHQIKDRGESREVECAVELNKPVEGTKRIVRLDTGEFLRDEAMTDDERQMRIFDEIDSLEKSFSAPDERDAIAPPDKPDEPITGPEASA